VTLRSAYQAMKEPASGLSGEGSTRFEQRETGRLEAFSDGIFAFAITLLVLGLRDPAQVAGSSLAAGLVQEWPAFFAFITSFLTILIMWVNHHNMFNYIRKTDTRFMFLNGLLLMTVTLTPFTTMLVGDHITGNDASTAAEVYSGVFILLAVTWNFTWRYASKGHRLLSANVTDEHVKSVNRDYNFGLALYVVVFALSFVNGFVGILGILLLGVYWAVTASLRTLVS